ncbi:MAG: hypothetical protein HON90_12910 [Halobacteriovoraceae bacterium]|jgi:hypothetical protein|nr:hypothetical protein [Halobacteriovoraceae bacterium]
MKILIVVTTLIGSLVIFIMSCIEWAPQFFYNKVVKHNFKSEWYSLDNYSPNFLTPIATQGFASKKNANEQFWHKFHFGDLYIPLPVKNPFYFVSPNLSFDKKNKKSKFGISINNAKGEKISDIYFLQNIKMPSLLSSQKLFELPLIRREITRKTTDEIWKDVFSEKIAMPDLKVEQMAYNLYLLQLRSRILKQNTLSFGFLEDRDVVVVQFDYANKDYLGELFMRKRGGQIYSFIIISRKENKEASLIRYKMVNDIEYVDSSPVLSDIIMKEFKSLAYKDQVDHVGMLYLLSAWSHDDSRKSILEKAIFFLERGFKNQQQLSPLYSYYLDRYKSVYSEKNVKDLIMNEKVKLQKNIHLESKAMQEVDVNSNEPITGEALTVEEQFEKIIKKSSTVKKEKHNTLRVD